MLLVLFYCLGLCWIWGTCLSHDESSVKQCTYEIKMYSKLREAHLVGNFTSALARPVLDLGNCASWGKSSVNPEEDSEKENSMGGASIVHTEDRTLAQEEEEDLRRMKGVLKESGLMCRRDMELDLLMCLRAHSFDVGKARAMYQNMVEWLQNIGTNTIKEKRSKNWALYDRNHEDVGKY